MERLGSLVKLKDLKVNTGKWRPNLETTDPILRYPKSELLMKAGLWTLPAYNSVRDTLRRAQLKVEVQGTSELQRVSVTGQPAVINVFKLKDGMPGEVATLPFSVILLDVRTIDADSVERLPKLPGAARMADRPVIIFGSGPAVAAMERKVKGLVGDDWFGQRRSLVVYTSEADPVYTAKRQDVVLLLPAGSPRLREKIPLFINVRE